MSAKVALVTGGTRGIGLAITQTLRKAGYKVAVVSREVPEHEDFDLHCKSNLTFRDGFDYSPIERTLQVFSRLDILINNAGEQYHSPFLEYNENEFTRQLELMLIAPFSLSQEAAKHMMKNEGGHIINILSTAAFQGARNIVGYVSAKHGLLGLTRAMAVELSPKIAVNGVAPGITETDMIEDMTPERRDLLESITPAGRFCTPQEIADAVMFLVNSTGIYGQVITVDNGWMVKNG